MQAPYIVAAVAWIVVALGLGWIMGRRGFEAYTWTVLGVVLGPIAVAIAVAMLVRPPSSDPQLLRGGESGGGPIDVLVGTDGSPESVAAVAAVDSLLADRVGRLTLARVVATDAPPDVVRAAEAALDALCRDGESKASTVLLRGLPANALREYATRLGYELIAVGSRGEGRSHAVLGSVASALARGSAIPVLVADATPGATRPSTSEAASAGR